MPSQPASTDTPDSQYSIDKELYDSTLSLREEMGLLTERLNKMEEHKVEVSEAVYIKVKSDYLAKHDQVRKVFEGKRLEIQKALQGLYQKQKEQDAELQKHREVLEEAKFRNFLGEFTDKKFKEVENKENTEIKRFENVLSLLQNNVKQYEDLIGGPAPEPMEAPAPPSAKREPSERDKAKPPGKVSAGAPVPPFPHEEERPVLPAQTPPHTSPIQEESEEDFYADLEGDYFDADEEVKVSESSSPKKVTTKAKTSAPGGAPGPEPAAAPPVERLKTEKVRPIKSGELPDEPVTSKTAMREETPPLATKAGAKAPVGMAFDDSISSILRSIPLEEEEEEEKKPEAAKPSPLPTPEEPPSITHVEEKTAKPLLICIEGELEPNEISLGENTSLGRSPSNDIVLKEAKVSRQHAAINLLHGNYVLVDLKSSNGVFVNGQKIEEHVLQDGDEISIGNFRLLYRA